MQSFGKQNEVRKGRFSVHPVGQERKCHSKIGVES